jgi:hypothetical protein
MKKCPTCEKTFEDSMRFCQADGTQLVAVAETIDPYKTMVARPEDIAAAMPPKTPDPAHEEGDVLQIPKADPNKTMFVSEDELRREMSDLRAEEPVIEIPPAREAPAPPAFIDEDLNPVNVPPPKPIPYTPPEPRPEPSQPIAGATTPPIPSPFSPPPRSTAADVSPMVPQFRTETKIDVPPSMTEAKPEPPSPFSPTSPASPFNEPPARPVFDEPAVSSPIAGAAPADQQMAAAEWTPPDIPEQSWQPPPGGQASPPAAAAGQSKTLAVVSLVVGILSCLCCFSILTGPIGAILGFMARGKAAKNPSQYGGAGLALGGIILGILGTFVGIGQLIYLILNFAYIMAVASQR